MCNAHCAFDTGSCVCVTGVRERCRNQFSKVLSSFKILKSISTTSVSSSAFWWNRSELRWQCRNIRIILGEHILFQFCIIVIFCMCCGSIVCHWNGNSFVYPAADSVRHFLIFLAPNKMTNGLTEAAAFCGNVSSIIVIIVVGPILTNQSTFSSKSKRRWIQTISFLLKLWTSWSSPSLRRDKRGQGGLARWGGKWGTKK